MISRLLQGIFKGSSNIHVAVLLLFKFRPVASRHSGVHAVLLSFVASKFFENIAFYSRLLLVDFLSNSSIRLGHLMLTICNIGLLDSHQWLWQKTQSPTIRSSSRLLKQIPTPVCCKKPFSFIKYMLSQSWAYIEQPLTCNWLGQIPIFRSPKSGTGESQYEWVSKWQIDWICPYY